MNPYASDRGKNPDHPDTKKGTKVPRKWLYIGGAVCAAGTGLLVGVSFLVFWAGAVIGTAGTYSRLAEQRKAEIEVYLSEHPGLFDYLEVMKTSDGHAIIIGTVSSDEIMELLETGIAHRFGSLYVEHILQNVAVEGVSNQRTQD